MHSKEETPLTGTFHTVIPIMSIMAARAEIITGAASLTVAADLGAVNLTVAADPVVESLMVVVDQVEEWRIKVERLLTVVVNLLAEGSLAGEINRVSVESQVVAISPMEEAGPKAEVIPVVVNLLAEGCLAGAINRASKVCRVVAISPMAEAGPKPVVIPVVASPRSVANPREAANLQVAASPKLAENPKPAASPLLEVNPKSGGSLKPEASRRLAGVNPAVVVDNFISYSNVMHGRISGASHWRCFSIVLNRKLRGATRILTTQAP